MIQIRKKTIARLNNSYSSNGRTVPTGGNMTADPTPAPKPKTTK